MDAALQLGLSEQRPFIRDQWEKLLRLDRGISALARPDTLVHLLDPTLDEFFAILPAWSTRRHRSRMAEPDCPCGRNPFLAYYATGRQALHEGLINVEVQILALTAPTRDEAFACVDQAFSHLARRDIELFCRVCQYRTVTHRRGDEPDGAGAESPLSQNRRP